MSPNQWQVRGFVLSAGVLVLPLFARARTNDSWKPIGPEGGFVRAIGAAAANLSMYLVTDDNETYRSTDGVSWTRGGTISGNFIYISQLAVDASDRDTALAAAGYDGVFRTSDGGSTWTNTFPGPNIQALGIAADPLISGVFLAVTNVGVLRTDDAGLHWSAPRQEPPFAASLAVVINPENQLEVFVATTLGLIRSGDGGATWSVGAEQYFGFPAALAFDPGSGTLFATAGNGQVIRSPDRGGQWEPAGAPLPVDVTALGASNSPGVVFAATRLGLFRSADGGDHWAPTSVAGIGTWALTRDSAGRVLAATSSGVLSSANSGLSWTPRNTGFIRKSVVSLAPSFAASGDLFAVTADNSVFKWSAAGRRWADLSSAAPRDPDSFAGIGVVATTPSDPSLVFAGYTMSCGYPSDSLASSTLDMTELPAPLYLSRDGGATWSAASGTGSTCDTVFLVADPLDASFLFMEHPNLGGGLQRTSDQGRTWVGTGQTFSSMVFDSSSSPETIVGTRGSSVSRSSDDGKSWVATDLEFSLDHLATASIGGEIYANSGEYDSSGISKIVYRSADHGQSWNPTSFTSSTVSSIAVDPQNPNRVFVASDRGIFESLDRGDNWTELPPSGSSTVLSLVVSPEGDKIFAGTGCCGVWELDLSLSIRFVAPPVVAPIEPKAALAPGSSGQICVR